MDQWSALKVNMDVLTELIETEKNVVILKMVEDEIHLLGEQLLATASKKWIKTYSALGIAHKKTKRINFKATQKHTSLNTAYSALKKNSTS